MMLLRSALFAGALVLVTPPYALLALATFPLPRMMRYRIISGWSKLVVRLARLILGIRWQVEGRERGREVACGRREVATPPMHATERDLDGGKLVG